MPNTDTYDVWDVNFFLLKIETTDLSNASDLFIKSETFVVCSKDEKKCWISTDSTFTLRYLWLNIWDN